MKYLKLSTLFTAFALFLIGCNKNVVVPVHRARKVDTENNF